MLRVASNCPATRQCTSGELTLPERPTYGTTSFALFCEQLATAIDRGTVVDLLGLQPLTRPPAVPSNIAHMRPAHPTKPTSCGPTNIPQVSFANHSARASAATAERLLWNVVATPDMMRAHAQTIRCDAYGRANAYPQL